MTAYSRRGLTVEFCLILIFMSIVSAQEKRPITLTDIFNFEKVDGPYVISPDGRMLAFVRPRLGTLATPTGTRYFTNIYGAASDGVSDIWLSNLDGRAPFNITNGESDGAGFWQQSWSPDRARLAMLSTRGGDVQLWIWERQSGRLRRLSDQGISLNGPGFVWVNNKMLAAILRPEGERDYLARGQWGAQAIEAWQVQWAGQKPSVSILNNQSHSAIADDERKDKSLCHLAMIDALTGKSVPGVDAVSFRRVVPAPDGASVAFLKDAAPVSAAFEAQHQERRAWDWSMRFQLGVIRVDDSREDARKRVASDFVVPADDTFSWAPDSQAFAAIATAPDAPDDFKLIRGSISGPIGEVALPPGMKVAKTTKILWTEGDGILVFLNADAEPHKRHKANGGGWWIISAQGAARPLPDLTESAAPGGLTAVVNPRTFVGVVKDDLWRLDISSGTWTNLTGNFAPKVASVVSSDSTDSERSSRQSVIVSVPVGTLTDFYSVNVVSGQTARIARPSERARLLAYRADRASALFMARESNGTFLTLVQGERKQSVLETNRLMSDLNVGTPRSITYHGLDGQQLKAWLLLPPKYESGRRYPLISYVYAGNVYGETDPFNLGSLNPDSGEWDSLLLLAAHGYVILMPSMPLVPGNSGDDLLELTKGVLPAVDEAIAKGIADSNRLAVMGGSYGGFSTYGLITQTKRFKAAIALAALSDLLSLYGAFDARFRYSTHYDMHFLNQQSMAETGQDHMGSPPWKDWGRYVRYSPIFYVDRVQTPLMIVHGDMDPVPITQAEEFFGALSRQGKRVQFVRYWGESHWISSPANVRDLVSRTLAWFDDFLDISRDSKGNIIFDGDNVKSRNGASALQPRDFSRFDNSISKGAGSQSAEPQ